jgi:hypothetical protein
MVHASINIHGVLDHTTGMSLTTGGQVAVCWDSFPSLVGRIKAPDIVVKVLVVCSSETIGA